MAGMITIIRGRAMKTNYLPWVYFNEQQVSYCTLTVIDAIAPGIYTIPEDQRTTLQWFSDNGFRMNKYGRLHIGRMMSDNEPDAVTIL